MDKTGINPIVRIDFAGLGRVNTKVHKIAALKDLVESLFCLNGENLVIVCILQTGY